MFLVLDYCDGGELFEHVADGGFHGDIPLVKRCFKQIMEGMRHVHMHQVSHLDMKVRSTVQPS
jgi:serine/threonine protein kinase